MKRAKIIIIMIVICLISPWAFPSAVAAPPKNETILETVFSELERHVIEEYYRNKYGKRLREDKRKAKGKKGKGKKNKQKGLPPGLAKRDTLPPGLAKQLQKNGRLPPGLEKRDIPSGLRSMLPRRLPGQKRVVVDNDILLIEEATGVILDILEDIF